ncbi:MAG: C_GCAxxG_C_C family protein [Lachnospiraceae bacterium]|nr:C_GCAxxG_C_C family protein [Lachnospiraceae bacterium]
METRIAKTIENHKKGYNCCQAVACAYCDLVGMDEKTMFQAAEAFGAGMGGMQATCGAVSGAMLLAGLKNSTGNLESPDSKMGTYQLSKEMVAQFRQKNGSVVCKELKGVESGQPLRSCDGCIEDAAALAEKILFGDK